MGNTSSSRVLPNRQQQRLDSAEEPTLSSHLLASRQTGVYPQLILFGDSITQNATLTLQPRLQALYVRRADVINRGFSGYNSILALESLPYFLPLPPSVAVTSQPTVRLVTLFLGANDAALPNHAQHVPLSLYAANLERIVQHVLFKQHKTKIVLITPAPVDEWQLEKPLSRTAMNTQHYARAAKELARKLNLPCVDLWGAFARLCGYQDASDREPIYRPQEESKGQRVCQAAEDQLVGHSSASTANDTNNASEALPGSLLAPRNETLASLLKDGLHFTPQGYDVLYDELLTVIHDQIPECLPENMPPIFESWRDILGVPKRNLDAGLAPTSPPLNANTLTSTTDEFSAKVSTAEIISDVRTGVSDTDAENEMDKTPHEHTNPCGETRAGDICA